MKKFVQEFWFFLSLVLHATLLFGVYERLLYCHRLWYTIYWVKSVLTLPVKKRYWHNNWY